MWDFPRSGIEPVSPVLAGRVFTTEPPGKPLMMSFHAWKLLIFMNSSLSFFPPICPICAFDVIFKKSLHIYCNEALPMFSSKSLIVLGLTFRSSGEFLCSVLAKGLTSFFCMWISSFPSTVC